MQIKSSLQNLTPNRPINGRFLNLTNSLFPYIPIATRFARRNLSIRDGQLIFNNSLIILNGHMSRFLTIVYARQFYSPRPPTHASLRSAWGRPGRIGSLITWALLYLINSKNKLDYILIIIIFFH